MNLLIRLSFVLLGACVGVALHAQTDTYIPNGSAVQLDCNCYRLTTASLNTSGSVWNKNKIDLNNSFDFIFNVYLGCQDENGADGIAFMLQQEGTSVGATGGGLGFEGVKPSVGVTLDTWQNAENNDPASDHISIQVNGNLTHGADLAGPVPASAAGPNVEDCQWHTLRVKWDAATHQITTWFDGVQRLSATNDIVNTVFAGQPEVYWGFSAATGGSYNLQQFCTALNPRYTTNATNDAACEGALISFTNASESFAPIASYYWDLGDGTTSTSPNIVAHTYPDAGVYDVKMVITGVDGCKDTLERTIAIGDHPVADFSIDDTCSGKQPALSDQSALSVGTINSWNWLLDGSPLPSVRNPDLTTVAPGNHSLSLSVTSNYGCTSANTAQASFEVLPTPRISGTADDGCVRETVEFNAVQTDNSTTISKWNWVFEPGGRSNDQQAFHIFNEPGAYNVALSATGDNGCESDITTIPVYINRAVAFAGRDTIVIKNEPFQLNGSGGASYLWSPNTYMNNSTVANPVIIPEDDITYELTVTTAEGCVDTDQVTLEVFKGSQVLVPTGFTPNRDGINDKLGPYYIGIREIGYFIVYNRWGQVVFTSHTRDQQWDGTINGVAQPSGVYIWRLAATDVIGKKYELKGSTTLIR